MGPVMVSLANRIPWLERQLAQGQAAFESLLQTFEAAGSLRTAAKELGLQHHEAVRNARKTWEFQRDLCQVLYRCDLQTAFESKGQAQQHNLRKKEQRSRRMEKEMPASRFRDELSAVMNHAATDHLRTIATSGVASGAMFSLPRDCIHALPSVEAFFEQTATKRRRLALESEPADADGMQVDVDAAVESPNVYFRVVCTTPGSKKTLQLTPGSGSRIGQEDMAI
eukprot:4328815-Lingulodinium_polyedra.AAC.1